MLMITVDAQPTGVILRLAGRLAGLEARELGRTRSALGLAQPHQTVVFDLTALTAVDVVGQQFLAQAHRNGDRLVGAATSRPVVDEIIARSELENAARAVAGSSHAVCTDLTPRSYDPPGRHR